MLKFLSSIFYTLQGFTDSAEKEMWKKFSRIQKIKNPETLKQKTCTLINTHGAQLFLLMEKKYKGYKNLSVSQRRKRYTDFEILIQAFKKYKLQNTKKLEKEYKAHPLFTNHQTDEKMRELFTISQFLYSPKKVTYKKSGAFAGVLQNPTEKNIIADCNQLTTLYVLLFAQRCSSIFLNVKLLPNHVCLHYNGVDFEATNGSITEYKTHDGISSVLELIGMNILDTKDKDTKSYTISPRSLLESARIARIFSSWEEVTRKHLEHAYGVMGREMLSQKKYDKAYQLFTKAKQKKNMHIVIQNAVSFYIGEKKFTKALSFAKKSRSQKYREQVHHAQDLNTLTKKIKIFKSITTTADVKKKKYTIQEIQKMAHRMDQEKIEAHCKYLLGLLKK